MANSELKAKLRRTPFFARSLIDQDPRLDGILHITDQLRIRDFSAYSIERAADVANLAQHTAFNLLLLKNRLVTAEVPTPGLIRLPRPVSSNSINTLLEHERNPVPNLYVMRHGAQQMDEQIRNLDAINQKIEMMKDPRNSTDPVTDDSLAEAVSQAVAFKYLRDRRGRGVAVITSQTVRAAQVGFVFSEVLGVPLLNDPRLDCVSYPNEPNEDIDRKLGHENKGSLPWDKEIIDRVIGQGTHAKICRDMDEFVARRLTAEQDTIIITHTQQTNRVDELLGQRPQRYPNLGYTVASVTSQFYGEGIFEQAA